VEISSVVFTWTEVANRQTDRQTDERSAGKTSCWSAWRM